MPKTAADPDADLKAFGSAFFHNYARMTWTAKKHIGAVENVVSVLLKPHKQNDGARLRPVALEFTFEPTRISVAAINPTTVDSFAKDAPLKMRLTHQLQHGPLTMAALATELGAKVNTIEQVLKGDKDRGAGAQFTRVSGPDHVTRIALVERRAPRRRTPCPDTLDNLSALTSCH